VSDVRRLALVASSPRHCLVVLGVFAWSWPVAVGSDASRDQQLLMPFLLFLFLALMRRRGRSRRKG
jgi:hypothetical protein